MCRTFDQFHHGARNRALAADVKESLEVQMGERGELAGYHSLRVGKIRIIYYERKGIIENLAIGPRKVIYYETVLRMRQNPGKSP